MRPVTSDDDDDRLQVLVTVRDWLRYAVSRFGAALLSYGHGTETALDEAAFLILETLHLPVDQLDPWLDARLTAHERKRLDDIIEARIVTRKPASYLTNSAWIQGHRFHVDERTIVPRSLIGELICGDGLATLIDGPARIGNILDLCTGGGSLAILAALVFPQAQVVGADLSRPALEVAKRNVSEYGLVGRVRLVEGDLFAPLAGERFDLIISNPPYVTQAAVAAFPPEYAAEPVLAHAGGTDGLDVVNRILAQVGSHLAADGLLVMEIGTGRAALEATWPRLPFLWLDTETTTAEVFALAAADLAPPTARRRRKAAR